MACNLVLETGITDEKLAPKSGEIERERLWNINRGWNAMRFSSFPKSSSLCSSNGNLTLSGFYPEDNDDHQVTNLKEVLGFDEYDSFYESSVDMTREWSGDLCPIRAIYGYPLLAGLELINNGKIESTFKFRYIEEETGARFVRHDHSLLERFSPIVSVVWDLYRGKRDGSPTGMPALESVYGQLAGGESTGELKNLMLVFPPAILETLQKNHDAIIEALRRRKMAMTEETVHHYFMR
ncbi:MAG: hypothetical protein WC897_04490 [Candidatus Gracilibacteria bacterium]